MVFGIIPECRSDSFRNKRSASPESPDRSPRRIPHKSRLFLYRRCTVLNFNRFQDANGDEIGLGLLLQAAFADSMCGGYAEIAGKGWCGSSVAGSNDNWGWSASSGRNAHSLVAISHAR